MVCAFTGHRQIEDGHKKNLSQMLRRAIEFAYSRGARRFLCGGAVGFDTEAAREVIKYRISHPDVQLVLVLPCVKQEQRWKSRAQETYYYTVSMANEVVFVSDEYTSTCMKERNLRLATEADILIAYVKRSNSGSAQTVRMAQSMNKEIYNIYGALDSEV